MPSHLVRVVMNETEPSRRRSDLLSPLPYAVILKSTARQPFPIRPMYTLSLLAVISLLASMLLSEAFIVCTKPSPEVIVRRRTHSILFMSTDALEKAASSSTVSSDTSSAESDTVIKSAGPCKNFPKCDGAYLNRGCGGTGKIQGGIATFPLLGWWPIKVCKCAWPRMVYFSIAKPTLSRGRGRTDYMCSKHLL